MAEHTQQNLNAPRAGASNAVRKLDCEEWEALLADYLDGSLPGGEVESFNAHQKTCASCAEMFSQAGQGREWLNFLRVEPQVSPALMAKILAQTSGTAAGAGLPGLSDQLAPASAMALPAPPVVPFWKRSGMMEAGRRAAQPRMMMTAAMAFFSITLTLNMAGVRLSAVRLADLKPATMSNNLNKQYHMASARVVRYYDNLRFVYEMEARVRELRRDADLTNTPVDKPDQSTPSPAAQDGPRKNGGKSEGPSALQPQPMLWGEAVEAELRDPFAEPRNKLGRTESNTPSSLQSNTEMNEDSTAGQAERGIA